MACYKSEDGKYMFDSAYSKPDLLHGLNVVLLQHDFESDIFEQSVVFCICKEDSDLNNKGVVHPGGNVDQTMGRGPFFVVTILNSKRV
jgi:hypothetical protein